MPVVIDGNNLLCAAQGVEGCSGHLDRADLCHLLARWARRRKQRVHIVFDGPSPRRTLLKGVAYAEMQVSFSGHRTTADAVLYRMLETDSAARRLVVVSSDREIGRAAKRRRARVVQSAGFWVRLKRDLARLDPQHSEPQEKEVGLDPPATERWLDELGLR